MNNYVEQDVHVSAVPVHKEKNDKINLIRNHQVSTAKNAEETKTYWWDEADFRDEMENIPTFEEMLQKYASM